MVRPREEQSTMRWPPLQEHMEGQIDSTQPPSSPPSSRRSRQTREAVHSGIVSALHNSIGVGLVSELNILIFKRFNICIIDNALVC